MQGGLRIPQDKMQMPAKQLHLQKLLLEQAVEDISIFLDDERQTSGGAGE